MEKMMTKKQIEKEKKELTKKVDGMLREIQEIKTRRRY